ncbi:MAG: SDR family oxidoreductase [Hyphomicrobiaceae bacterium]
MKRLAGKTMFITAAGAGIGRASAIACAAEGAKLFASDVDPKLVEALKKDIPEADCFVVDASSNAAIADAAKRTGPVDVLFNCAGWVHHGTILQCTEQDWDRSFDLNVKSMWRTITAYLPAMLEKQSGSIINIASAASSFKAAPNRSVYAATKAAVIGLTKSVAIDFADKNVRCNAVCPGTVDTPSLRDRIKAMPGDYEKNYQAFVARQKLGRLATADEIAHLIVYLASDESAFVTGSAAVIDGGWSI